jgi:secreted PhoX family phosphatase
MKRRQLLKATGTAFAALAMSGARAHRALTSVSTQGYGPLIEDPEGLLSLPQGFRYQTLSRFGDAMSDGLSVPDKADGMGCFERADGTWALVRNHELLPSDNAGGSLDAGYGTLNGTVLPGGTTHIVLDPETLAVKQQFRSLSGTIRNCSGGVTPWGTWLTCEEAPVSPELPKGKGLSKTHGWVFEVPADAEGPVIPEPLYAMGRFNHEAACVDPRTGVVYLTEDRDDSVLYRFLPDKAGDLAAGGQLQAMRIDSVTDTRHWQQPAMRQGRRYQVDWINLEDVHAPKDDLRQRAAAAGAALIARGEGIHMGDGEVFFCATSGGEKKLGQVFRLVPSNDSQPDVIDLFFESTSADQFNYGDNLTVAPDGHLVVCEDQYTAVVDNHLRGISPDGHAYPIGKLHRQTEFAGACFSPDGKWLFVNVYSPTQTLAITGPWHHII